MDPRFENISQMVVVPRSLKLTRRMLMAVVITVSLGACAATDSGGTVSDSTSVWDEMSADSSVVDSTPTQDSSAVADTATGAKAKVIQIEVTVGVDDDPGRTEVVPLGSSVQITFENPDDFDSFHLHGYDIETGDLEPEEVGEISFTANKPGEFEVESHETGDVVMTLIVK